MRCPRCEHENAAGQKFCGECGARLAAVCGACGAPNGAGQKFCGECGTPLAQPAPAALAAPAAYTPKHLADKILRSRGALEGERKPVTVLFCDVVESTRLAERLDPEAMHEVMDRVLRLIAEAVHRYEGTVNQFLGDGVMALFGAPVALEDHALRAVHAALAIRETIDGFSGTLERDRGLGIRLRIGLNTGTVVVGKIGDDLRMDYTAVGDTTHLAARMQQTAEPGAIVVAEATHRLVDGHVHSEPLGAVRVKGVSEPVEAHRIVGRRRRTRLAVRADRGLTELVGRRRELDLLRDRFEQARAGRGQVVGIVGEAGVGKSRLLFEFRAALADQPVVLAEGACLAHARTTPYGPILDMLATRFHVEDGDNPLQIEEKLRRGVSEIDPTLTEVLPLLRELFALPLDPGAAKLDPQTKRRKTFEALRALVAVGSQRRVHVIVVEDLHWIDTTSEDYVAFFVESVAALPVLLLTTYRPGYTTRWADRGYATQIVLDVLDEPAVGAIIGAHLGGGELPPGLVRLVHEKAEGNPLFVEEIVRSLDERGALVRDNGRFVWAGAPIVDFPAAGQDIIRARVDQLAEPVKRTLQTAAVIGRGFGPRILAGVAEHPDEVPGHLDTLKRLDLIRETRFVPEVEYAFKHALIQDVAYQMLLAGRRRELHGAIGRALEEMFGERRDEYTEVLADHFARSDEQDKAVEYLCKAGERAAAAFAIPEAAARFEQALGLTDPADRALRADLYHRLAEHGIAGIDEPDTTLRHAEAALALHQELGDRRRAMMMHTTIAMLYIGRNWDGAREDQAIPHLEAAAAIAETEPDSPAKGATYQRLAHLNLHRSAPATAHEWAQRAVDLFTRLDVPMGTSLGTARAYLGFIDDGLAYNENNWAGAIKTANPLVVGILGHEVGTILALARDARRARAWGEHAVGEFLKIPAPKRGVYLESGIRRPLALACVLMGDSTRAAEEARLIEQFSRHGWSGCLFEDVGCISLFHLRRGDLAAARRVAEQTVSVMRERGQLAAVSACAFVLGCVDLAERRHADAERHLRESAAICRDGGNVLFELWVLPVLTELYLETERVTQAAECVERGFALLEPGRAWYGLRAGMELARGMLARESGDWDEAEASFDRAVGIDREYGLPWDQAKARSEWSRMLRRRGRGGDGPRAREHVAAARALFEQVGALEDLAHLEKEDW